MLGTHKLVLDTFCEVHDFLAARCDQDFWNFEFSAEQQYKMHNLFR